MPPGSKPKIVGVIPARLHSQRLPGKVLRQIAGRAMLHHVYDRARECSLLDDLLVATDSEEVRKYCAEHQIPVLMTAATHRSGTERIHEVMQKNPAAVFLNLQADEPLLTAGHLRLLAEPFLLDRDMQVTTLKTPLDAAAAQNPNVVKVVTDGRGQALYFSRAPIPYRRDTAGSLPFYKHLGLYGYRRKALAPCCALPSSTLEQAERLEQLRFLENAIPIHVLETAEDTIGVDTEEDWEAVTRYFDNRGRLARA